jgi:hypothetical protein
LVAEDTEHAHQSSDFSVPSRVFGVRHSADTCWSDTDDFTSQNLYQCPGTNFRTHSGGCPGAWIGGYGNVTGTVPHYICQSWSQETQSHTAPAFKGTW